MTYKSSSRWFVLSDSPTPPQVFKDRRKAERLAAAHPGLYFHMVDADAKLSEETVREIIDNPRGLSTTEHAEELGIAQSNVTQIRLGKRRAGIGA